MTDELVNTEGDNPLAEIEKKIEEITEMVMGSIEEDRDRAEDIYIELLSQFYQGKNTPDDLRELNKAQEMIQNTTGQYQKVLDNLTKIKAGDTRIQIANITQETKKVGTNELGEDIFDIRKLNEQLNELEDEKATVVDISKND